MPLVFKIVQCNVLGELKMLLFANVFRIARRLGVPDEVICGVIITIIVICALVYFCDKNNK